MVTILREVWLCEDCTIIAVNGDASGLDYSYEPTEAAARLATIEAGLERLGWISPNWDSETGDGIRECYCHTCDCCGAGFGTRHRFAILGDEPIACQREDCYLAVDAQGTCEVHGPPK